MPKLLLIISLLWTASAFAYCPPTADDTLAAAQLALQAGDGNAVRSALACLVPVAAELKAKGTACAAPTGTKLHVKSAGEPIVTTPPGR